jgi:hypothetical protein
VCAREEYFSTKHDNGHGSSNLKTLSFQNSSIKSQNATLFKASVHVSGDLSLVSSRVADGGSGRHAASCVRQLDLRARVKTGIHEIPGSLIFVLLVAPDPARGLGVERGHAAHLRERKSGAIRTGKEKERKKTREQMEEAMPKREEQNRREIEEARQKHAEINNGKDKEQGKKQAP